MNLILRQKRGAVLLGLAFMLEVAALVVEVEVVDVSCTSSPVSGRTTT